MTTSTPVRPLAEIFAGRDYAREFSPAAVEGIRRRHAESVASGEDRLSEYLKGIHAGVNPNRAAGGATGSPQTKGTHVPEKKAAQPAIKFNGTLLKCSVQPAKIKQVQGGYQTAPRQEISGGSIELTLVVERPDIPEAPKKPEISAAVWGYGPVPKDPGKRPGDFTEPKQKSGEADDVYATRVAKARAKHEDDVDGWDSKSEKWQTYQEAVRDRDAKWEETQAKYQRRLNTIGAQFAGFTALMGIGGITTGLPFSVAMTPNAAALAKFLPGFSPASILGGGASALLELAASAPEPDDDDIPDDGLGDDADGEDDFDDGDDD